MANGICIFAEHFEGRLEPVTAELAGAAMEISRVTKEPIKAVLAASDCTGLIRELSMLGVEEIWAVSTGRDMMFEDDAMSRLTAEMIKGMEPSAVLVPATPEGRSVFSRTAVRLGCGLTADCTELSVGRREDGSFYIKQNKPSYGENVFVTIVTKENCFPQMMTVRPGVFQAAQSLEERENSASVVWPEIEVPGSGVRLIRTEKVKDEGESIQGAEKAVIGGRGILGGDGFELMKQFAEGLGAAVGGTRPLADMGKIPFENQIGQTGCTIRPKICVSLGVSGAIQHTEGIKDTKRLIAVNTDKDAPIFNVADYGLVGDAEEILREYLKRR